MTRRELLQWLGERPYWHNSRFGGDVRTMAMRGHYAPRLVIYGIYGRGRLH